MTTMTTPVETVKPIATVEAPDARRARITTSLLILVIGVALLFLAFGSGATGTFALSDVFDAVQLPSITVPAVPVVLVSAVVCLLAGAGLLSGRLPQLWRRVAGVAAALAVLIGFLSWASSTSTLPFPIANQLAGTVALATPLILGALAGTIGERAGVVNVAIEGQFLNAAFSAAVVGSLTGSIPAALVAAMIAGMLTAALLGLFAIKYLVDQVVLGVVINLLASGLTGFLFDQLVQPNTSTLNAAPIMSTIPLGPLADIPLIGSILFDQTILVYLAVISVVVVWFLLFKTRWGLRVRAVGEHPKAADTVGISVNAVRWQAILVGGIFAGLGGAFFTVGSTGTFVKDLTAGNGFIALAALIMGRWHPMRAAMMALFFGFVTQMASQLQTLSTPVPSQFLLMLPYVATIIAVAGLIGKTRAPAADGQPYVK